MASSSIFIYMMHIICYCRCSDGTKVIEGPFRPIWHAHLDHGPEKSGQRKDAMWHSCMSSSISSKHKPLTNVRNVQWILHWPVHSTQISIAVYTIKFNQILSPFCDDAGLPAHQISSSWWYLTYHVSALAALLESVLRYPQQCWNSLPDSVWSNPEQLQHAFFPDLKLYLTVYDVTPNNILQHEMFLIWNSVPEPSSTNMSNI